MFSDSQWQDNDYLVWLIDWLIDELIDGLWVTLIITWLAHNMPATLSTFEQVWYPAYLSYMN